MIHPKDPRAKDLVKAALAAAVESLPPESGDVEIVNKAIAFLGGYAATLEEQLGFDRKKMIHVH